MCYANGASAQLPSASPPSPIKSNTLKDSPLPAEVSPVLSLHSGVYSSGQEHSFASHPETQVAACDKENSRGGETERKIACSCSNGAAHTSERHCNVDRHVPSAVDKDRGSMEPVVTGRPFPEWSQTHVSEDCPLASVNLAQTASRLGHHCMAVDADIVAHWQCPLSELQCSHLGSDNSGVSLLHFLEFF